MKTRNAILPHLTVQTGHRRNLYAERKAEAVMKTQEEEKEEKL